MLRSRPIGRVRPSVAGVVLGALVATGLSGCAGYGVSGYPVTAYFSKAVSLYKYSNVRVLGLPAGKVTGVETDGDQVRVTMRIKNGVNLPAGVQAAIVPASLIGERYVQLYPAWVEGQAKAPPGTVIPVSRTEIPVEPDETLATLKKFLDSLDPHATGSLITNLSPALAGNGQELNNALGSLSQLSSTLADKDTELGDLIDHFDAFASTLDTREAQLGQVMNEFATTTQLLVQERQDIEGLVHGLAVASGTGLALIGKHQADLRSDLSALTRILEVLNANVDNLQVALKAGPELVAGPNLDGRLGLNASYDPVNHHIDLRTHVGPLASALLAALGLPPLCTPIDTKPQCTPTVPVPGAGQSTTSPAAPAAVAPPTSAPPATTPPAPGVPPVTIPPVTVPVGPLDGVMGFLSSPAPAGGPSASSALSASLAEFAAVPAPPVPGRDTHSGFFGWARRAARAIVEAIT